ncbi:MAG TPA: LytTR family DNA-binding domain-containing protein [Chitinophagaceae bacterium]|nr:LytTR family DNA-binding domain-containing protein [Chitinophagaceae bacterium]
MKCIIVDDNPMARMAMKKLAEQVKDLSVMAECENAIDAYNVVNKQPVDFLLLDIEMPGMTGLELTKNLGRKSPLIIFTTAKTNYAVDAFELNVVDYLVKPIEPARFLKAIDRVKEAIESEKEQVEVKDKEFVFVRDNGILKKINSDDILYLEAMGDYVKVFTSQKFHIVHATLKSIEEKLPSSKFMRVHRSYIIALNKIDYIEEGVISINGTAIPVADAYRTTLNNRLNLL